MGTLRFNQVNVGVVDTSYVAAQGAALQRAGRVQLRKEGECIWVGGDVTVVVQGDVTL